MPATPDDVATVEVAAPPAKLWDMVSDIRNMGRWSPETFRTRWLGGSRMAAPGARFRGWNRWHFFYWATNSVVDVAEPGREFTFTTLVWGKRRTRWSYRFEAVDTGTRVTETRTAFSNTWFRTWVQRLFMPGHKESFAQAMATTLQRIKAAAEGS